MFRVIDDDGNRKLDFNEFKKGLSDYGVNITNDEAKTIFASLDRDSSGTIDFDEFLISLRVKICYHSIPILTCYELAIFDTDLAQQLQPQLPLPHQTQLPLPRQRNQRLVFLASNVTSSTNCNINSVS